MLGPHTTPSRCHPARRAVPWWIIWIAALPLVALASAPAEAQTGSEGDESLMLPPDGAHTEADSDGPQQPGRQVEPADQPADQPGEPAPGDDGSSARPDEQPEQPQGGGPDLKDFFGLDAHSHLRWLTRPLAFSRNTGLDSLTNLPRFDSADTLPGGAIAFDLGFNFDVADVDGTNGDFIEAWLGIDFSPIDGLQFRVQTGLASWTGGPRDPAVLGTAPGVNTGAGVDITDLVLSTKLEIIDVAPLGVGVRAEVKLPVGSTANFLSNGDIDIGLAFLGQIDLAIVRAFAMLAITFTTGDGEAVFAAGRRASDQVLFSGALGASVALSDSIAVLMSSDFHTDYRGTEDVWTLEGGVRIVLPIGIPMALSGGFSYNLVGDSDFAIMFALESVFALPSVFG